MQAALLLLPSYRRFPKDEEFQREIKLRDLYNFRSRSYWLRRLENHGRKERVVVEDYTIEHILPQNEDLSPEWQQELGLDWQRIQEEWLHTLGNPHAHRLQQRIQRDRPSLTNAIKSPTKMAQPHWLCQQPTQTEPGLGRSRAVG